MQGEYRGDFTRDTFHPAKRFLRVLYQQGRVQLDADFNEQVSILLHYLQSLARDLYGPHGGPSDDSFAITATGHNDRDFNIGAGHYYVDGILCEAEQTDTDGQIMDPTYLNQPYYPVPEPLQYDTCYLVYLDVWERHITHVEDGSIREVALGGPDTATRAQLVWQVKTTPQGPDGTATALPGPWPPSPPDNWRKWVGAEWSKWRDQWQPSNRGMLKAQAKSGPEDTDPCITSPESRYRGAENQLYRVEIHAGGAAADGAAADGATFKWSRENGSVTFPILELDDNTAVLEHLGRDSRFGLAPGDWVEIVDDDYVLQGRAEPLLQVDTIDRDTHRVTLKGMRASTVGQVLEKHPLLRRWDHKAGKLTEGGLELNDGAALIREGGIEDEIGDWLELEDGVLVQFWASQNKPPAIYRTGDYWLIPARTATGDVEWPRSEGDPDAEPPHGILHHYAPLAMISVGGKGAVTPAPGDDPDLRSRKRLDVCGNP